MPRKVKHETEDAIAIEAAFDVCNFRGCGYVYKRYGLNADIKDIRTHKLGHEEELRLMFKQEGD